MSECRYLDFFVTAVHSYRINIILHDGQRQGKVIKSYELFAFLRKRLRKYFSEGKVYFLDGYLVKSAETKTRVQFFLSFAKSASF